jgi:hypothetical protein
MRRAPWWTRLCQPFPHPLLMQRRVWNMMMFCPTSTTCYAFGSMRIRCAFVTTLDSESCLCTCPLRCLRLSEQAVLLRARPGPARPCHVLWFPFLRLEQHRRLSAAANPQSARPVVFRRFSRFVTLLRYWHCHQEEANEWPSTHAVVAKKWVILRSNNSRQQTADSTTST